MSTLITGARPARVALALSGILALGACASPAVDEPVQSADSKAPQSAQSAPAAKPAHKQELAAVPGYAVGEIPPIPLFRVPNVTALTSSSDAFSIDTSRDLASVPGVIVEPAFCDGEGAVTAGGAVFDGSGGFASSSAQGGASIVNSGDGSGVYFDEESGVSIIVGGDGSGSYNNSRTGLSITVNGDGSGSYNDSAMGLSVTVDADGSGSYNNGRTDVSITVDGNKGGAYNNSRTKVSITNNGDGTGTYLDQQTSLSIINNGDGTAMVNGEVVEAEPLAPVGAVGPFPSVESIPAAESCGTKITLEDSVLFDFGSDEVRADAAKTLDALAEVLTSAQIPSAQINGHTDSISDEAFNLDLSQRRAQAVVDALTAAGVSADLQATGFGESQPVAPNENADGSDNPAGRQANRRVEIFIPAF